MAITASLGKCVLNVFLNLFNVLPPGLLQMLVGSEFHSSESVTQKALSPMFS